MTPVTIGDQKFIKDPDKGWIDSKTKQPADKGLIRLLDSLVIDEPVVKKLRVKIDKNVEPISINGQKFVYDVNQGWIDEKTKTRAPDSLQRTLSNAVPRFGKNDSADIDLTAGFGIAGKAAVQKTKVKEPKPKKTGSGTLVNNRNTSINKPLVAMINQLASIDSYLKQQLQNKQIVASKELAQTKEADIEAKTPDSGILENTAPDAEKENSAASMVGAAGLAALIAYQFDPVKETIKGMIDFGVKTGEFVVDIAKSINSAFDWILGDKAAQNQDKKPNDVTASEATVVDNPAQPEQSQSKQTVTAAPAPAAGSPPSPNQSQGNRSISRSPPPPAIKSAAPPASTPVASPQSSPSGHPMTPPAATPSAAPASSQSPPPKVQEATQTAAPNVGGINARDVISFTSNSGDENHFNMLEPETKQALLSAAAEYKQTTGTKLILSSGRRTNAEQWALWNNRGSNPNPVAYPGTSNHEHGWAVDIGQKGQPQAKAILEKHGLMWYGDRDKPHYTLKGHGEGGGSGGVFGVGSEPMLAAAAATIEQTLESAKNLFSKVGRDIVGADRYEARDITPKGELLAQLAKATAIEKTSTLVESRTPTPPPSIPKIAPPPNINPDKSSPVIQTAATSSDMGSVYYYLERFGFKTAEAELPK